MTTYGTARWATPDDLARHGMTKQNRNSLLLGRLEGSWIYHNTDRHLLTVAPPGTGKTVSLVIPNLLTYRQSVIVTDPKGALTAQTARRRRDMGQKVVVLNPWRQEMTEALGQDLGDSGFNPLRILRPAQSRHDNARLIGWLLCPTAHDERDPYWTQAARSVLIGCLLHIAATDKPLTLPYLAGLVRRTRDGWADLAADMVAQGDLLAEYGEEILGTLESEKQWTGVLSKVQTATDIYRTGDPLGDHIARDEFDPADLKRQDITVYIVIPSNRRDTYRGWLALVLAMMTEAVGRPGPAREILLIAEEFANLGYMPTIGRAMAEYREAGLKVWLFIQNLNQLTQLYGKEGGKELFNYCQIRQFFGITDNDTASLVSLACGQKTVTVQSSSMPNAFDFEKNPGSTNQSQTGTPLIRLEQVQNLRHNRQIILTSGPVRPILADLLPYWDIGSLQGLADPNPYRSDPASPQTDTQGEPTPAHISIGAWPLAIGILSLLLIFIGGVLYMYWNDTEQLLALISAISLVILLTFALGGPKRDDI